MATMKVALLVVLLATSALAGNYTDSFYFSGGLPFCSQCGSEGMYACSNGIGNFRDTLPVKDQVPYGSEVANNVIVELHGAWSCDSSTGMVEVDFNGIALNVLITEPTDSCACGTCDRTLVFQGYFPAGFPKYDYDGYNNVGITLPASYVCINQVQVTVGYGKPLYPGLSTRVVSWENEKTTSLKVCNGAGYSVTGLTISFEDPLPEHSLLVMAEADVFGSYFCQSSSSSTTLKGTLQGTVVDQETLSNHGQRCYGTYVCDGAVRLSNSILYQGGWPNYQYGGTNSFLITSTPYTSYIGKSQLVLYFYEFSSKEERDAHVERVSA